MTYEIKGEPMPAAICRLSPGEALICEAGAMRWMSPDMEIGFPAYQYRRGRRIPGGPAWSKIFPQGGTNQ